MTSVDRALLMVEWSADAGKGADCPLCGRSRLGIPRQHGLDCAMDLALSERGFFTQEERDRAREFIQRGETATAPTLPPAKNEGG